MSDGCFLMDLGLGVLGQGFCWWVLCIGKLKVVELLGLLFEPEGNVGVMEGK